MKTLTIRRSLAYLCPLFLFLFLIVARPGSAMDEDSLRRQTEQVEPTAEKWLREHLRKLDGWGVAQLLRTEQRIDREQKRRANTSANPQELALLADDEDPGVRFFVAANRNTPLGTKIALASDAAATVRTGVALSVAHDPLAPASTQQVLEALALKLAADRNILVRLTLVQNQRLPSAVFEALASDPDFTVRLRVASHVQAPRKALARLATDGVQAVQIAALSHRNQSAIVLQQMASSPDSLIRRAVCLNVNTPPEVLDLLAGDSDPQVRRMVASHANTPLPTLQRMAKDGDAVVLMAVARHPRADRSLLTELAYDDRDPQARLAAQDRLEPLLRREIRDDVLERWTAE